MRRKLFRFLATMVTKYNVLVLSGCAVLTLILILVSGRLTMKTQIAEMMPQGIAQVEEFMEIMDEYKSTLTVMIAVESEKHDVAAMKRCAEELAERLGKITMFKPRNPGSMSLRQKIAVLRNVYPVDGLSYDTIRLVERIDYKVDREFIDRSGMIIQRTKDLENMTSMFGSLKLGEVEAAITGCSPLRTGRALLRHPAPDNASASQRRHGCGNRLNHGYFCILDQ